MFLLVFPLIKGKHGHGKLEATEKEIKDENKMGKETKATEKLKKIRKERTSRIDRCF